MKGGPLVLPLQTFSRGCAAKLVLQPTGGTALTSENEAQTLLEQMCAGILNGWFKDTHCSFFPDFQHAGDGPCCFIWHVLHKCHITSDSLLCCLMHLISLLFRTFPSIQSKSVLSLNCKQEIYF